MLCLRATGPEHCFQGCEASFTRQSSINSYNSPVWTETNIPRNSRRRPPAKIFHQSLVWYCSWCYTPPLRTFCTHNKICSKEHFGAITNRIAGGCATRCLSSTIVDARQSQHIAAWTLLRGGLGLAVLCFGITIHPT